MVIRTSAAYVQTHGTPLVDYVWISGTTLMEYMLQSLNFSLHSCIAMPSPNRLDERPLNVQPIEDTVSLVAFAEAIHRHACANAFFEYALCVLGSLILSSWYWS